ncbi:hypothetical protein OIV53_30935, partial [Burkholderia pseudomallei]|nr:hypothetical protein [Burkholderia pseudomallei]
MKMREKEGKKELKGKMKRRQGEREDDVYAMKIEPLKIDRATIQVRQIWHRKKDAQRGLRWMREQVVLTQ